MRHIDADSLIKWLTIPTGFLTNCEDCNGYGKECVDCILEYAIKPHIETVRCGKWVNAYPQIEKNPMFMYGICSLCGFEQSISMDLKFCPNCGAKMCGDKNESNRC